MLAHRVVAVVEDAGASARTLDRPGLREALAHLEAGDADGLLVAKLDRLTRRVSDLATLLDRGFQDRWALLSVGEQVDTRSAGGRLVLNVLCSVAEWERAAIGERTSAVLQHMRAEGVRIGGEALGWERTEERDSDGRCRWRRVRRETRTVQRILELNREGHSRRAIARALEGEGHRTKRGGTWTHTHVGRVLARSAASVPAG